MAAAAPQIAAVLDAGGPRLGSRVRAVDLAVERLAATTPGPSGRRAERMVAAGGKRLRPLLVLLFAGDAPSSPADETSLTTSAAGVELVHVATLLHDDVLDRAPTRRGEPTVWAQDGEAAAVAAGDALLATAFDAVARDARPGVAPALSTAAADLAVGELMQRADAYRLDITPERYRRRVVGKTAALFDAACRIGALHSGDVDPDVAGGIGRDLGVAFQMLDDLLDVEGDPAVTGKPRGTDLLDGTVTLPLALAVRRQPTLAAVDLRALGPEGAVALCDQLVATGICDEVRGTALRLVADVRQRIAALGSDAHQRRALDLAARALVERTA